MSEKTNVVLGCLEGRGRWCIDTPALDFAEQESVVDLRGWVALPIDATSIEGPFLEARGSRHGLVQLARDDVARELADFAIVGFDEVVDVALLSRSGARLVLEVDHERVELELPRTSDLEARGERFSSRKARKLERVGPLLCCPRCRTGLRAGPGSSLFCPSCGLEASRSDRFFTVLDAGEAAFSMTPPFSAHAYDAEPRELVSHYAGGLLLDGGCGLRYEYFDDVVNLDLTAFPTTDVVSSLERLPFGEATFDAAISVAVLEHLEDPRRCVEELARVVRPGGGLYAAVPFLQPYHGYPHHYFNMTRDALRSLFSPFFAVEDIYTPHGGLPIRAVSWMLEWYLAGLSKEARAELSKMTIGELAGDPSPHFERRYVTELSSDATAALACVNVLVATRK